ncbi:MAG: hypothetical protein ACKV2V_02010 [Blastocatellia bacterium]
MQYHEKTTWGNTTSGVRETIYLILTSCALALGSGGMMVFAGPFPDNNTKETAGEKNSAKKTAAGAETPGSSRRRDPFVIPSKVVRPDPPPPKVVRVPMPVLSPGPEVRLAEYRSRARQASQAGQTPPGALSPYLIKDLMVNGVFRNGEGYGAFVVENISGRRMTLFIRPGQQAYDGYVRDISPAGVRFARTTRMDDGSSRQAELMVAIGAGAPPEEKPKVEAPRPEGGPASGRPPLENRGGKPAEVIR